MTARFNLDVFVVLSTDFTKLECGAHFTVQLILFLFRQSTLLLVIKGCTNQSIHENRQKIYRHTYTINIQYKIPTMAKVKFHDVFREFP